MASEKRFGYEWQKYHKMDLNHQNQFVEWILPFKPDIFKDKKVLDAGCGMGRNSYWVLKHGAKELVAFDNDERTVQAAKNNLAHFKNARVEEKSIYQIDYQDEFDISFSIGVIHHLEDPDLAIKNLVKATKPGGLVLVWLYGYENNEWIVKWISPLRINLTSKLPIGMAHLFSYCLSIPLYLFVKVFPQKSPYLKLLSQFKFNHTHSIVFDQLLPKIAKYYKKEEARQLLEGKGLENIEINQVNKKSWTVYGYKK
jgi:SAM-dependent methyltransferase|tara:strand:+ start:7034 stop:7798 length:765 start_codon:yes stop_codon:yes gene_type:complete